MRFPGPTARFLCPDGYAGRRGALPVLLEHRAWIEAQALVRDPVWRGHDVPDGSGMPVLLVPGLMVGDPSLAVLTRWLRRRGYWTYRSGVALNVGCPADLVSRLAQRLQYIVERRRRRVAIVGHSRGGMLAKLVAIRHPELVAGIVTLGSPHLAPAAVHPIVTINLAVLTLLNRLGLRQVMGADCLRGDCATESWTQLGRPLRPGITFTSVYSRSDGIVDWRACLDPDAEHVEVRSSHIGMAVHPGAYRIIGDRLGVLAGAGPVPKRPAERPPPARRSAAG